MNCPQCQTPLREGASFCTRCGARTSQAGAPSAESVPTAGGAARGGAGVTGGEADALAGRVLDGKYEIVERLGAGGMGSVYRARRVHIGDEVAVKVLHTRYVGDETLVERFRREARAAAQLHHPNVVTIHDYGEATGAAGFAYIVMELVAGASLRELMGREGRLSVPRAVSLMRDICAGVAAAHRRDIVHRDIKPENIIVLPPDEDHDAERVKVVDFGIAKLHDMVSDSTLTHAGAFLGTPVYMSPEQCRGEHLDARADVYSLGALLYEMLAGSSPFAAQSIAEVISKHLTVAPPPLPRELNVPAALADAITRALSKDREGRQRDAAEFAREIQSAAAGAATAGGLASATGASFLPTTAPPSQVVPVHAPPPRPTTAATPTPPAQTHPQSHGLHTQPTPHITIPPPKRSWVKIVLGILAALFVVSAAIVAAWLSMPDRRGARRAAVNVRPTPRPMQTPPYRTPSATPTPNVNANAVAPPLTNADVAAVSKEVGEVLEGWAEATRERDLNEHMAFYAGTLETYYKKSGVPASQVRADRARAFERFDAMSVILSNIEVTPGPTGTQATAVFDKSWAFESLDEDSIGAVRQQLTLKKVGGRWLITGEKDLQVLYTSREEN